MAVSFSCKCEQRQRPIDQRRWVVLQRNCNHSAFNGYAYTPSDWSEVACLQCLANGRTKAKYVDQLPDDHGDWERALTDT